MGLISKAKEAIRESAERRAAEQQALQERMRTYMRGYDVFPDEVCGYFVGKLRGRIGRRLIIPFRAHGRQTLLKVFRRFLRSDQQPLLIQTAQLVRNRGKAVFRAV